MTKRKLTPFEKWFKRCCFPSEGTITDALNRHGLERAFNAGRRVERRKIQGHKK